MLGHAQSPLVSGARGKAVRWVIALLAGLGLGSSTVVVASWSLGRATGMSNLDSDVRWTVLLVAVTVFMLFDLPAAVRGRTSLLGISRQTPKALRDHLRDSDLAALIWGADIGFGVTTYRNTSAIWLALLSVALGVTPLFVGFFYGAGIIVTIGSLIMITGGGQAVLRRLPQLMRARRPAQLLYVMALTSVGLAIGIEMFGL